MRTREQAARGDMFHHSKRSDIAGREMEEHGTDRPIVVISGPELVTHELIISLYSTHGGHRSTLLPIAPVPYSGQANPGPSRVDTQQLWTFPLDRLDVHARAHLSDNERKDVLARLSSDLTMPTPWPKTLRRDGVPTVGSVVWYRIIARHNDDHEAVAKELEIAVLRITTYLATLGATWDSTVAAYQHLAEQALADTWPASVVDAPALLRRIRESRRGVITASEHALLWMLSNALEEPWSAAAEGLSGVTAVNRLARLTMIVSHGLPAPRSLCPALRSR